jgi:hypothetical protein
MVHIVRPGSSTRWRDEDIQLDRATVEVASPKEAAGAERSERGARVVPEGSVKGDRTQTPVSNEPRKREFGDAWDAADLDADGAAGRSLKEIRDDVASGKITPEEGVRRIEGEISFNQEDLNEVDANLRQPDLSPEQRTRLQSDAAKLQSAIDAQKKASKFMRMYLSDEKPTIAEVRVNLDAEGFEALQKATPDDLREAARMQGLDPPKGETKEEMLQDLVRQVAGKVARERGLIPKKAPAKKAAKAAKKAAPTIPTDREKLDVRTIGAGIDFDENDPWVKRTLDEAQKDMDEGKVSPAKIGSELDDRATSRMTTAVYEVGNWHSESSLLTPEERGERKAANAAEYDRVKAEVTKIRELAERLKKTRRRPAKKAATPEVKAAETRADSAEARLINERLDQLSKARSREQGESALDGLTMPELRRVGEQLGGLKGRSKQDLRNKILDRIKPELPSASGEGGLGRAADKLPLARRARNADIPEPGEYFSDVQSAVDRADRRLRSGDSSADVARELRERAAQVAKADLSEEGRRFKVEHDRDSLRSIRKSNAEYLRRVASLIQQEDKKSTPAKKATPSAPEAPATTQAQRAARLKVIEGGGAGGGPSKATRPALKVVQSAKATEAAAPRMSDKPIIENTWGDFGQGEIGFHADGIIGTTLRTMGDDQKLEVDGDALANVVGRLATRAARGQISQEQLIDQLRALGQRLPADSSARRKIDRMVSELDAPAKAPLSLPEETPAPIRQLMEDLSKIPLARGTSRRPNDSGGTFNEMDALQELMTEAMKRPFSNERVKAMRLMESLRTKLYNHRHESMEGKLEIDRAIRKAMDALDRIMREPART